MNLKERFLSISCSILCILLVLSFAACAKPPAPTLTPVPQPASTATPISPVKIGKIDDMSGAYATYGERSRLGTQIWETKINEAGGIKSLKRPIKVILGDSRSDPNAAASEAERLITQEKVELVITGPATPTASVIVAKCQQYNIPIVIGGASTITKLYYPHTWKYVLGGSSLIPESYALNHVSMSKAIMEKYGINAKVVLVANSNNPASKQYADQEVADLKKQGVNVSQLEWSTAKASLVEEVLKMKSIDPDVVLYSDVVAYSILFWRALYQVGWMPRLLFGVATGTCEPKLWENLGNDAARATIGQPGVVGLTLVHQDVPYPGLQTLIKEVGNRGSVFSELHCYGPAALYIATRLIDSAGSLDLEKLYAAARNIKIYPDDPLMPMPIWTPYYALDQNLVPIAFNLVGVQWRDGKMVLVWPPEIGKSPPSLLKSK